MATKIGTILMRVSRSTTALPNSDWLSKASETPHQVSMEFIVAANSQAPKRYQDSEGSLLPASGVNRRAIPAKSMQQKAIARIVAHLRLANSRSPSKSDRAYMVVLKLKISKAIKAAIMITPNASPRRRLNLESVPLNLWLR